MMKLSESMILPIALNEMRELARVWLTEGSVHQRELGGYLKAICNAAERAPPVMADADDEGPALAPVIVPEPVPEAAPSPELPPDEELEKLTAPDDPDFTGAAG